MIYFDTHKTLIVITLIKGNTFLQSKFRDERFMIIIPSDLAPDYTKDYHGIIIINLSSLNLHRGSTFNFERLVILRDSIRHPSKKLLSFELAQRFNIQFRVSRYITGLIQTSE